MVADGSLQVGMRFCVALLSATLLLALTAAPGGAPAQLKPAPPGPAQPIPGGPKLVLPDLVVRSIRLQKLGECTSGKVFLYFDVTLVNVGQAEAPHQPESLGWVKHTGSAWLGGVESAGGALSTHGPIPPGKGVSGVARLFYQPPKFPPGPPPWTFRATADPYKVVPESKEGNNDSAPITVTQDPCQGKAR